jgi:tetratricopeptide (TPR) repeat protein
MTAATVRDRYGLPLSTTRIATEAFAAGLDRVLALAEGAEEHFARAIALDPGFALGHAALALLGFEQGVRTDCTARLAAARKAAAGHADERERSFIEAVGARIADPDGACDSHGPGARAVLRHIRAHPKDAMMVCVAVPTVAFGGVTSGRQTWSLVESLQPVYGDDWWYCGQLAFVRQAQGRWDEAERLAARALEQRPAAGHAVHARAHVFYETGRHDAGLGWLDGWITEHGPRANSRAHFSWHAALHELALDDGAAFRRRYQAQLAPPIVTGPRALVDSGAILWRSRMAGRWAGEPGAGKEVLQAAPPAWLCAPPSPFATMHAALGLALDEDAPALAALGGYARAHTNAVIREVAAPLCSGLLAVVEQRWGEAADLLAALLPRIRELQGSAAQLEVVEDTVIRALIAAGRTAEAAERLSRRLDRRHSPLDRRNLNRLQAAGQVL